jgi:phosphoglycolate phosphatase
MGDGCGVIFDLDGTLADTLMDIAEGVNAALTATGRGRIGVEEVRRHVGHGVSDLMAGAAGSIDGGRVDRGEVESLVSLFRAHYGAHHLDHTILYPGVAELLDGLTAIGHPMSVLSNKPHDFTVRIVDELMSEWSFVAVDGGRAGETLKPDPAVALSQAAKMGRGAADVVLVGDSPVDFETARNAGMRCVLVTWGFTSADVIRGVSGAWVCESTGEVMEVLRRKSGD